MHVNAKLSGASTYMFSLHSIIFLAAARLWQFAQSPLHKSAFAIHLYAALGLLSVIASRQHYSADVLVAAALFAFLDSSQVPDIVLTWSVEQMA